MNETSEFDAYVGMLAEIVGMSRRLQPAGEASEPIMHSVPRSTPGEQWRTLIDRLNEVDPEGGWGKLRINGVDMIATKGEFPGGEWIQT